MMAFTRLVYVLAFASVPALGSKAEANPMQMVIELLEVMSKEIVKDGEMGAEVYAADVAFHKRETKHSTKILKEVEGKIAVLETDLQEADAFRKGKNMDLVDLANHIAKDTTELEKGRDMRKEHRAEFEKNEATFLEANDQLKRALEVMDKQKPVTVSASPTSSSLLSIAQQLKTTLTHSSDIALTIVQRETLNSFVRHAATLGESQSPSAISFLQQGRRARDPAQDAFEEYGGGGGGLIASLQTLQNHVQQELDVARGEEVEDSKHFKEWEMDLETWLENSKKSKGDMKMSIAQSEQQSSQNEASLMESKEIEETEAHHLDEVEIEFRQRTQEYKNRLGKRQDEAIAVHEAQRILSSEVAKSYMKHQTIGDLQLPSFVQLSQEQTRVRRTALQVFRKATTPGLALLALKSTVHYKSGVQAEPFRKVKSLLREMLDKLMDRQAEESKHAEMCDREMGKTTKSQRRKEDDIQKIKDRLEALQADLAETNDDIKSTTNDLKDMQVSLSEAESVRKKEHKNAGAAVKMYADAVSLLERARNVLKSHYKSSDDDPEDKGRKFRQGTSTGVVGLLEIAIDDFKASHKEAMDAEDFAEHDFQRLQSDNSIRMAVFEKDLEYKSRAKVKAEFDESNMKNDLQSYEKELSAVDSYMDKLKASCIVRGPSYEEKKSKREAELKSLKEALSIISVH